MPARKSEKIRKRRARTPVARLHVIRTELDVMERGVPISILFAAAELRRDLESWIRDMRRRVERLIKTLDRERARKAARRRKVATGPQ